jgi:hypothetical protein
MKNNKSTYNKNNKYNNYNNYNKNMRSIISNTVISRDDIVKQNINNTRIQSVNITPNRERERDYLVNNSRITREGLLTSSSENTPHTREHNIDRSKSGGRSMIQSNDKSTIQSNDKSTIISGGVKANINNTIDIADKTTYIETKKIYTIEQIANDLQLYNKLDRELWDYIPVGHHVRFFVKDKDESNTTTREERYRKGGFLWKHIQKNDNSHAIILSNLPIYNGRPIKSDTNKFRETMINYSTIDELWKKYDATSFIEIWLLKREIDRLRDQLEKYINIANFNK